MGFITRRDLIIITLLLLGLHTPAGFLIFFFLKAEITEERKTSSSSQWPNLHHHQIAHGSHHCVTRKAWNKVPVFPTAIRKAYDATH